MGGHRIPVGWLVLCVSVIWAGWANRARLEAQELPGEIRVCSYTPSAARSHAKLVPLEELPPAVRANVSRVIEHPTLFTRGPSEEFTGSPDLYQWLLDHPDRAAMAWRRLGAQCMDITDRGNGHFGWTDGQGSDVHWETIYRTPDLRIWYAEGSARPGPLLPAMPVRAVVVLHHAERHESEGHVALWHQADVFLQTDSKTAVVLTRMLGPSVPHMAEQGAAQLEMFFSALLGYCERHPDRAEKLLSAAPVGHHP